MTPTCSIDVNIAQVADATFIGMGISTFLSGVVIVQAFSYLQDNNDKWLLRLTVVFMILMDLGVTISVNMFIYHYLVTHFGDLSRLIPHVESNRFITTEVILGVTVIFMVEIFFARHVYLLRRTHWSVSFFIVVCALAAYALALAGGAKQFLDPYLDFDRRSKIDFGLGGSLSALSDIVVTFALLYSFQQSRTGFRRTDSMLQTLFRYTFTRGILVTVFQIIYVVLFLAKTNSLEWAAFQMALIKTYVITMLAMLNSRKSIRANHGDVVTVSEFRATVGEDTTARGINDNSIGPMEGSDERYNGTYQLKEYSQSNPDQNRSHQPTTVYITRFQETHDAV